MPNGYVIELAICTPETKNVMDAVELHVTVKNISETVTIPAGMYCEIYCGEFTIMGTTMVDLAPGESIVFGEGLIITVPVEWAGTSKDATAIVWKDNTKTEQLITHTCSDLLNVPLLVAGFIQAFFYWYEGLPSWQEWTGTITADSGTDLYILVDWGKTAGSWNFCGHMDLEVIAPDDSRAHPSASQGQDRCTEDPWAWVAFGPITLNQEGSYTFFAELTETGTTVPVLAFDSRLAISTVPAPEYEWRSVHYENWGEPEVQMLCGWDIPSPNTVHIESPYFNRTLNFSPSATKLKIRYIKNPGDGYYSEKEMGVAVGTSQTFVSVGGTIWAVLEYVPI